MADDFDIAKHNRAYFDNLAAKYDVEPWQKEMSSRTSAELQRRLDFIGVKWAKQGEEREVRLLDYACGTGMISRALGPYVTQTRGIDISSKMVERYNEMAKSSGLSSFTAHAIEGDLFNKSNPSPSIDLLEYQDFDVAAVGFGFHHFGDHELAIRRLAERLKPGGVVLIIDFADSQHMPSAALKSIKKHGFTESEMKEIFEGVGLTNVGYSIMEGTVEIKMEGNSIHRKVFFGKAQKQ